MPRCLCRRRGASSRIVGQRARHLRRQRGVNVVDPQRGVVDAAVDNKSVSADARAERQRGEEPADGTPQPRAALDAILLGQLVAEAIGGGEQLVLVVAAEQHDVARVDVAEEQQRREHLHAALAAVDEIAVEDHSRRRAQAAATATVPGLIGAHSVQCRCEAAGAAVSVAEDVGRRCPALVERPAPRERRRAPVSSSMRSSGHRRAARRRVDRVGRAARCERVERAEVDEIERRCVCRG